MSCTPSTPRVGKEIRYSDLPDCEKLKVCEDALFQLSSGQQKAEVRYGENLIKFHPGANSFLEREVKRLRAICGGTSGPGARRAITIGRACR